MKKMNLEQMEQVNGGNFWGKFCKGANEAAMAVGVASLVFGPVSAPIAVGLLASNVGCWIAGY